MRVFIYLICFIACFSSVSAQQRLTVEAPSSDPTLIVRGPEREIVYVNDSSWLSHKGSVSLFTEMFADSIVLDGMDFTAIQIDKNMRVIDVFNRGNDKGNLHTFSQQFALKIPNAGFVLVVSDQDNKLSVGRKFLVENFKKGDVIKLRLNDDICSLEQFLALSTGVAQPTIDLKEDHIQTVLKNVAQVQGCVSSYKSNKGYQLILRQGDFSRVLHVNRHGEFDVRLDLKNGVNYFDLILEKNQSEIVSQPLIYFVKNQKDSTKEHVMWVEQFPNAKVLVNRSAVAKLVKNIKSANFTAIGLDVKGPEGYVSYRKNDLSHSPYLTETSNSNKKIADTGFDLLDCVIQEAHAVGIKVYASFNFFTEGNITTQDYAVLKDHQDWEEIVQRPEDKGKLLRITESRRGKDAASGKLVALAFVNPSNIEVQDFQLLRVEEVLKNYDVDGIVLDRCRYDNLYADFSHISRNAFEDYLAKQDKFLENFPADAFKINSSGQIIKGKFFKEWVTFRSQTISDFTARVRTLVDSYKEKKNPNLMMAAYVGSWYEAYYQNGVNWASSSFSYNSRLGFPESQIYGEVYNETSYLKYLDFLMIGTYYKTAKEIERYITLGNILTRGQCPILGAISLPDLKVKEPGKVIGTALKNSAGLMIFDYCYVDWENFVDQMKIAYSSQKK